MESIVSLYGITPKPKPSRDKIGRSLLSLPVDYTVIDLETTGLDPQYDEIIEMAAIRVRNGAVIDTFVSLVKPANPIDEFITELTGISNEIVEHAPAIGKILPDFLAFVGDDIVIGHNVGFDIRFLYDSATESLKRPFENDYVDTLRFSRKLFPEMKSHRLAAMTDMLNISSKNAHRALSDCYTTNALYAALCDHIVANNINLKELYQKKQLKASTITPQNTVFDVTDPAYGKTFVFTGILDRMTRREAMQLVVDHGGFCEDRVTARTNYLVLGNNDYCKSIKDGKSNKQKKAEKLILEGQNLEIISENVFCEMTSMEEAAI